MPVNDEPGASPEQIAWNEHNLPRLRYFASLTLREKFQAIEGMCDVARRLQEMRDRGSFETLDAMADHRIETDRPRRGEETQAWAALRAQPQGERNGSKEESKDEKEACSRH